MGLGFLASRELRPCSRGAVGLVRSIATKPGPQYPEAAATAPGSVAGGARVHFPKPEDGIEVLVDGYPVKIPKRMTVLQSMASFGSDGCRFTAVKRSVVDKNLGTLVKTRCIQCTRFATKVSGNVIDSCHAAAFKGRNREFDSLFWTSGSVYRNEFLFLWDTGASVSTVDVRVVDMLHLRYEKCRRSIWVLGCSEAEILGVCRLTWMMGGVRFGHEFEIMRTFDKSFTLGTDFMRRFRVVSFHFDEREVTAIAKDNKTLKFTCVQ